MNRPRTETRRQHGFTLLEMMIVVLITGILAAAALPSYSGLVMRQRVVAKANALVADVSYARTEAIRRAAPVSLCPSADGATCTGGDNWSAGRIVFVDLDGSGALGGAGETVLRVTAAASPDAITVSPATSALVVAADGTVGSRVAFTVCAAGNVPYLVNVSPIGRARVAKGTAAC